MSGITLILIATGLAMDAFAVAIAASLVLGNVSGRQIFRLSFHFGLFQALMPIIGWLAGRTFGAVIAGWDHWVAFGLLSFIGVKAIRAAWSTKSKESVPPDPTRGMSLVALSVATSIDALAVGISLALLQVDIWYPSVVIGFVALGWTVFGMLLGQRLGERFSHRIAVFGGLILIAIGLKILIQDLF
jgi:manganese efflux pump family protein